MMFKPKQREDNKDSQTSPLRPTRMSERANRFGKSIPHTKKKDRATIVFPSLPFFPAEEGACSCQRFFPNFTILHHPENVLEGIWKGAVAYKLQLP
jgi:hypothetical protein